MMNNGKVAVVTFLTAFFNCIKEIPVNFPPANDYETEITWARRILFVLSMLFAWFFVRGLGSVGVYVGQLFYDTDSLELEYWTDAIGTLAFGMRYFGVTLAIWFAGRYRVRNTKDGFVRALVYLLAFTLGGVGCWPLQYPFGSWWIFTELFALSVYVWLLIPLFIGLDGCLATVKEKQRWQTKPKNTRAISMSFRCHFL